MPRDLEVCSNCRFTLIERSTYCPHCGAQLTQPSWKKAGAWILLILIVWGLAKCHYRILQGLDGFLDQS